MREVSGIISTGVRERLRNHVWDRLRKHASDRVWYKVGHHLLDEVGEQTYDRVYSVIQGTFHNSTGKDRPWRKV